MVVCGKKTVMKRIVSMFVLIMFCVAAMPNTVCVYAEQEFTAAVRAVHNEKQILIDFNLTPKQDCDLTKIKVLDSYGKNVVLNWELTNRQLKGTLSDKLNYRMEYAVVFPKNFCSVSDNLLMQTEVYFEPTASSKEAIVPNIDYYSGYGDFSDSFDAVDTGDAKHGKAICLNNDGTVGSIVQIIGAADSAKTPFWDSGEADVTVLTMDVYMSAAAHNFDYRIFDSGNELIGYCFFDRGGNFVVANGSGSLWCGSDFENAADYEPSMTASYVGAKGNQWYTIKVVFDKVNKMLNYWVDNIFVASAVCPQSVARQIKEIRIQNTGCSKAITGYIYVDNIKNSNIDSEPEFLQVTDTINNAEIDAKIASGNVVEGINIEANGADGEYIVQYSVETDDAAGGLMAMLKNSNGSVFGGAVVNAKGAVCTTPNPASLLYWSAENNAKDFYNTYGRTIINNITVRNYQALYGVLKSGGENRFTYLVNPTEKVVKVWVDGHYLGQSVTNADTVLKNITFMTYAEGGKIKVSDLKVGYPVSALKSEYVKSVKFKTADGEYGIYSSDTAKSPISMEIAFSRQMVVQSFEYNIRIYDENGGIVKTDIGNYDNENMKLSVTLIDKMHTGDRCTVNISNLLTADGRAVKDYRNTVSLKAPQISVELKDWFTQTSCTLDSVTADTKTLTSSKPASDAEREKLILDIVYSGEINSAFKISIGNKNGVNPVTSFVDKYGNFVLCKNSESADCIPSEDYGSGFVYGKNVISPGIQHKLTYVFDNEQGRVAIFADDRYIGRTEQKKSNFGIPKNIVFEIIGAGLANIESVSLGYEEIGEPQLSIVMPNTGHIFYDCTDISYILDAQSKATGGENTFDVTTKVSDADGAIIYQSTDVCRANSIGRLKEEMRTINLKDNAKKQYGIFKLSVELADEANGVYLSAETEFSSVMQSVTNSYVAVSNHFSTGSDNAEKGIEIAAKAGIGTSRDEIRWQDIESEKGIYNLNESNVSWLESCKDNGVEPYVIINGNSVYLEEYPPKSETLDEFGDLAYQIAQKTKSYTNKYEVWNEYNVYENNELSNPEYATAEDYAQMLKATYGKIHEGNENAVVYGMCATYTGGSSLSDWIDRVLTALNGEKYMDAVSIHLYFCSSQPETSRYYSTAEQVKAVLQKYPNYAHMPVVVSETGWHSSSEYGEDTELRQAKYTVRCAAVMKNRTKMFTLYKLVETTDHKLESENKFGIVRPSESEIPYAAKPAFVALACFNSMLGDSELEKTDSKNGYYCYRYKNSDGIITYMLWTQDGKDSTYNLSLPNAKTAYLYDMFGNKTEVQIENGVLSIGINDEPVYVRTDDTDIVKSKITLKTDSGGEVRFIDDVAKSGVRIGAVFDKADFADGECKLIYAWYKGNMLKNVKVNDIESLNTVYSDKLQMPEDITDFAVFMWDGLDRIKPVDYRKIGKK